MEDERDPPDEGTWPTYAEAQEGSGPRRAFPLYVLSGSGPFPLLGAVSQVFGKLVKRAGTWPAPVI